MDTILQFGYIGGIGLAMILFFYNHGFKTANRFLAAFFFVTSLYACCQYFGLYNRSLFMTALFATSLTPLFFLMGPY